MWKAPLRRAALVLITVLLAAGAAGWLVTADEWVPAGPMAEDPGMGQGSDWDRRWLWATSSAVARERGVFPHWDPYLNFGTPLFSEPESFLSHPAYALVAPQRGMRAGMDAVYAANCFLMLLGLAWLGWRLRVPFPLAMATALFLLGSDEWFTRLGSGHPMVLGICLWPGAAAATLAAMDPETHRWEKRLLLGAVAGLALGIAGLTGAHYPLAYGMLMVVLLTWASAAPGRLQAALVALCCVPLAIRSGPDWARYPLDLIACTLAVVAVMRGGRWRHQLATLAGVGLGLLGTAGFFLVSAAERASQLGRLTVKVFDPPGWNPMPLQHLLENGGDLESYLSFAHPAIWVALLLGLALCALRSPALAATSSIMLALAWSLGLPLRPWELVSAVPGMAAADLQMRMQWIVLVMAPLGLATGLAWLCERFGGPWAARILCTLAAAAIVYYGAPIYQLPAELEAGQEPKEVFPEGVGTIHGWAPGWAATGEVYSRAPLRGLIIPIEYGDPSNFRELAVPEVAGEGMAWLSSGGEQRAAGPEVEVSAMLNEWTLRGPPGAVVAVPQRDLPGWSCEGGELKPDLEYMRREREAGIFERDPGVGMWFLSVEIGASGEAVCTWRTPGLLKGILQQLLALGLLAGIAVRLRLPAARQREEII